MIPEAGTSVKIAGYPLEIMQIKNNMIKTVRIKLDREVTAAAIDEDNENQI